MTQHKSEAGDPTKPESCVELRNFSNRRERGLLGASCTAVLPGLLHHRGGLGEEGTSNEVRSPHHLTMSERGALGRREERRGDDRRREERNLLLPCRTSQPWCEALFGLSC